MFHPQQIIDQTLPLFSCEFCSLPQIFFQDLTNFALVFLNKLNSDFYFATKDLKNEWKTYFQTSSLYDVDQVEEYLSMFFSILAIKYRKQTSLLPERTFEDLKMTYATFELDCLTAIEIKRLLHYWNNLLLTLTMIPARKNKTYLLKLLTYLEGSGVTYVTGSGQTKATTYRLNILEKEGDVSPQQRARKSKRKTEEMLEPRTEESLMLTINSPSISSGDCSSHFFDNDDNSSFMTPIADNFQVKRQKTVSMPCELSEDESLEKKLLDSWEIECNDNVDILSGEKKLFLFDDELFFSSDFFQYQVY